MNGMQGAILTVGWKALVDAAQMSLSEGSPPEFQSPESGAGAGIVCWASRREALGGFYWGLYRWWVDAPGMAPQSSDFD